jgi:hypothetical protein
MDYSDVMDMDDRLLRPSTFLQFTRANKMLKAPDPNLSLAAALEAGIKDYAPYGHYYDFLTHLKLMLDAEIENFEFIPHPGHRSFKAWFNLLGDDYINRHFVTGDILTRRKKWLELMDEYAAGLRIAGNVEDSEARFLKVRELVAVNDRLELEGRQRGDRPVVLPPVRQPRGPSGLGFMDTNWREVSELPVEPEDPEFKARMAESLAGLADHGKCKPF